MGALVTKQKHEPNSAYTPGASGLGPDGILRDQCVEGILNLENRQVNNEAFAKISTVQSVTKQVLSLSLANNRLTSLQFDSDSLALSDKPGGPRRSPEAHVMTAAVRDKFDDEEEDTLERESSVLRSSTVIKPLPTPTAPLRASANWPMLENLDLSGNNELFNYSGLETVTATLRSLRLANNGIFKVPIQVWSLVNLTKLDLSHNRLLVLPPGISLLTKLNSLKLSHNSLAATGTTSCIPEEMKFCSRLRRLDLSHNKLRELPVNWRVDRENQRRASTVKPGAATPTLQAAAASTTPLPPLTSAAATSTTSAASSSSSASSGKNADDTAPALVARTSLSGGAGFSKSSQPPVPEPASSGSSSSSFSAATGVAAANAAPVPIKFFDPNRVSYIQITLLNLSNNQMDSLSPSIGLLRSLNSLNLGYNKLRSLPTEIALLTELKYLDLRFNQLPSLLTEICQLPRISKLCLQNNKISSLPYEIRKLKKLTHFFISSNQLVDLPDVIAEIRNVRVLKLCNNKLLTIPDSMFRLQKLRLLDLSFNKLTYISPDVCSMPLIEDLRLWGNRIADIPSPILYSDVKKIIHYLRATERERHLIAHQMRSMQGPRSFSRVSVKSTPRGFAQPGRAMSATRATSEDRRFAPLGFYEDREDDSMLGGGAAGHRSLASAPARGGGAARLKGDDSGSENEDMGSDDEFTSMFRAVHSRTGSFTNLAPGGVSDRASSSTGRRSTVQRSPAGSPGLPSASPRDTNAMHTTIVQPFSSSQPFSLSGGIMSGSSSSSAQVSHRPGSSLRSIRDQQEQDDEDEADIDVDREEGVGKATDVLTDMVRRDWRPNGSPQHRAVHDLPHNPPPRMALASRDLAEDAHRSLSQPTEALMEEWDMQSQAIEKQQSSGKATGRGKIGAVPSAR